ncbi:FkbM family methyltransferase [Acetobacter conturbans]|nr:FkbM family methyltransferase [Acetobacter conturbans]
MIVNRYDYHANNGQYYGVGYNLLERGSFDKVDVILLKQILDFRREQHGDGVIAIDGGANIGVHTLEWARHMNGWGYVISVEAQERIFYALAGNVALNNCFNARVINAALSDSEGSISIPVPDYRAPASFGSLELKESDHNEDIGQPVDYRAEALTDVASLTIDSFGLPRLDLIKIDVEGMEIEVLEGARESLRTLRPVIFIEYIKVGKETLTSYFAGIDYIVMEAGINIIAVHKDDPLAEILSNIAKK